jgi:hypothetical protein
MLAYPPDFNEEEDGLEGENLPKETSRYLTHIEQKLYEDILKRKRIDAGLLFLACQISSCSLSWVLFQLQITLSVIQVFSAVLSLLPGLIDVGDSFNFSINAIFIRYLVMEFSDIVWGINSFLMWLKQIGVLK